MRGLWADDHPPLSPDAWVDVWKLNSSAVTGEYWATCQVKDLDDCIDGEPLDDFMLVPVQEAVCPSDS